MGLTDELDKSLIGRLDGSFMRFLGGSLTSRLDGPLMGGFGWPIKK